MKKVVRIVILSVFAFCLSIACKNYTEDIEDYLSYWSAGVSITEYRFEPQPQIYTEGMQCVSSKAPVTVTFTVHNSKNLNLKMPGDSDAPADIISFPHIPDAPDKRAAAPQSGNDYEFKKISNTALTLTYNPAFLQKYEWGRGDITPSIILYTTDGRVFKQNIPFKLNVNTPPPAIAECVVGQTETASPFETCYYVLCLQLSDDDMKKTCGNGLLHGDIAGIEINGTIYRLSVAGPQKQLNVQGNSSFIDKDKVKKLDTIDAKEIPSDWTLYFKTKVKVKPDSPETEYTVKLKDAKGLYSEPVTVSTQGKIVTVTFNLAGGKINGSTVAITRTGVPGDSLTKPENPTKDGYTFNSWNPPASPTFPATDTVYTAQWTANQYKVRFNGNENTGGSMSDQTFTYGTSQALQSNGFTKDGYTFKGWAYSSDATTSTYTDGQSVSNLTVAKDAVVQLYAVWHINTYIVKFKVDGEHGSLTGTHSGTPKTANGLTEQQFEAVPYNSTITFTATPAAGYDVDLWTGTTPESGNNKKASLTVQNNVTVIVKFRAVGGQSPAIEATSWEDLRTKVQSASDGTVIEVTQDITYGFTSVNSIIEVKKNITIKSKDSNKYTLDANGKGADREQSNDKSIGIFEVSGGKTLTLEKLILTKTEKYAIYVAEGDNSLTMKNVTIKDCKTKDNAAGIYFNKGKTLTLENCTIEKCNGNGGWSSGGIDIEKPTETVSIKDTTIKNCKAPGSDTTGGGIHLWNGECTLENVTVDNCSAKKGGGMCVKKSTLTITGGSFTKNAADGKTSKGGGGAIYSEDSTVTITGCTIGGDNVGDGNSAGQGGGIFVSEDARCTLNAGTKISGNKAIRIEGHNSSGGGIFVDKVQSGTQAGTLTINRSSGNPVIISENTADYGGGVYNYGTATINHAEIKGNNVPHHGGGMFNAGTCTMDGVTLQNNKAKSEGGGIYSNKELTLKNTTVTGNEATASGGAIQIATADAVFNMSGSTVITVDASKNDIYLTNDAFITLTGKLTAEGKIARITLDSLGNKGYKADRVVVKGGGGFNITADYKDKFTITDKIGNPQHWKLIYQSNALKLK